ncbi:MAG: Bifunctional ligase/repressor BirA [Deltaproteobacteria bacterium ADurb.BinA179]|jgi:BirA family biotin operon repressor/biotin-[acetyl-CoA-carboxylase] ligase|nr:biotin--[acetyl-CoA-carboxylase] ligase [Deltaproteobacteria bacterium]MDI9542226.1 biotin--[acetyl-CoA-carboxylase] ligase [Pseudomonadota bacterium]OPZ25106.1 MAG: Bifunctional ligase/repressor BirA [Deltaproteobacteria bacterium ADurb.BinA179]HOE72164.1 biotin--[acetyl-CoA-carboxylase] ligase [Deltaproteobacteria bacterium]HOS26256.1 biotin--[acetyl-CoA-carboxylase] ligase [Deltaproteobacteria bacterium]
MAKISSTGIVREIVELHSVGSTNTVALDSGRPGLLVVASEQTAGRGRKGRTWFSPAGTNLYMTLTVDTNDPRLPLVAGVAVREALSVLMVKSALLEVKWPNDLIVHGRKLCGILCESRGGITAVGIGVNVNQLAWPPDLADSATSLALILGREVQRQEVLRLVLTEVEKWLFIFARQGFEPVRRNYLEHGLLKSYALTTEEGVPCSVVDMNSDGHLLINAAGTLKELVSGSIRIIP